MMKHKLLVTGLIISLSVLGVALAVQTADQNRTEDLEALARIAKELGPSQPDTSSPNWKQLSGDVGLMLFTDHYGTRCGTLYARSGDLWQAVALEGPSELGPEVIPLGGR